MAYRVLKQFDWDGRTYRPGNKIDIDEGHPRLGAMVRSRFITGDATGKSPDDRHGQPVKTARKR